ncbi:LytR/AlgR family response regulator transcription factor [Sunxiuqinia rutila]|uniref:LytR/AlgR family response regulator transcription factor n=1 Tax=Sunxiuqinia rutila TaxID=1397841 RepID=UPI003D3682AE
MQTIKELFVRPFPQNLLIRKPVWGALLFLAVLFVFIVAYHPLQVHETALLSFQLTVLAYCALIAMAELLVASAIARTNGFSPKGNWTVSSELLAVTLLLLGIGISTYFAGFVMEPASSRWNWPTFFDSFSRAVLVGLVPVLLPSLFNIRYAFAQETFQSYELRDQANDSQETLIQIESKAKKEHLEFYPHEFLFAESQGNYVVFHLIKPDGPVAVSIRNSISDIETQLAAIPHFMRTHRAFIVNLKQITSRTGNALGYRLSLANCTDLIPVSRQNARQFEQAML